MTRRERCAPEVRAIRFAGAASARPLRAVLDYLADPGLAGILICPSNPFLSIDPILAVPGLADAIRSARAPVVAVSPLVGGAVGAAHPEQPVVEAHQIGIDVEHPSSDGDASLHDRIHGARHGGAGHVGGARAAMTAAHGDQVGIPGAVTDLIRSETEQAREDLADRLQGDVQDVAISGIRALGPGDQLPGCEWSCPTDARVCGYAVSLDYAQRRFDYFVSRTRLSPCPPIVSSNTIRSG